MRTDEKIGYMIGCLQVVKDEMDHKSEHLALEPEDYGDEQAVRKYHAYIEKERFDPLRDPLMQDAFDSPYMAWDAWEHIRRLTCLVCGSRYVRQLEGDPNAEKVCEEICQKIYDLRMEITKNESSTD